MIHPCLLVSKSLHVECFPVTSLENIRLDLGFGQSAQVFWSWSDRLVLHRPSPDWLDLSDLAEGSSSHKGLCNTRFWTFTGSRFLPLFDMVLCFLIGSERKLLKWLQEDIEKFVMLNKLRLALRRMCVCGYAVHIWQLINIWVAPFSVSVSRDQACWRFCLGVIARVVSCPESVSLS